MQTGVLKLYVFMWLDSSSLFNTEEFTLTLTMTVIAWMYQSLSIHSLTKGHLVFFQNLAIMNKAAINTPMCKLLCGHSFQFL